MNWETLKYISLIALQQYLTETGDKIVCCTAQRMKTRVDFAEGRFKMVSCNIKQIEDMLNRAEYFRSHKSNLVSIADITRVDYNEGRIYLKNNITAKLCDRKVTEMKFIIVNRDKDFIKAFRLI
jgi:DNA-binding LytR/AlgR family response regulator